VKELHGKGMRYVPIIDAGLAYRTEGYDKFTEGVQKDVFMKINNEILIGAVWPNDAAFPDYFSANTA
jgi:alpha-glucosidase (family GH31 glycosyl hydrolase)